MPIINEEIKHEMTVYYMYGKNDTISTTNSVPKVNNGYCKLNIKVILKTYETHKTFYDISYTWGFKPWGEWGDANMITNNGNLLSWEEINNIIDKFIGNKKSSSILEKAQKLKNLFPFINNEDFIESSFDGEIIKQNAMTDQIVKHLCMTNTELKEISGNTSSKVYRINIMHMITNLWD